MSSLSCESPPCSVSQPELIMRQTQQSTVAKAKIPVPTRRCLRSLTFCCLSVSSVGLEVGSGDPRGPWGSVRTSEASGSDSPGHDFGTDFIIGFLLHEGLWWETQWTSFV